MKIRKRRIRGIHNKLSRLIQIHIHVKKKLLRKPQIYVQWPSNLDDRQVSAPTYDDLLFIYEKMSNAYNRVRKKNIIFKEKYYVLEKAHISSIVKYEDL